jgi:hypothetical protein
MTVPLLSFSYTSTGCDRDSGLLLFGAAPGYKQMGVNLPTAQYPGSGVFPTPGVNGASGNFWVRQVSVTVSSGQPGNWVVVGHSGPNGDLISEYVLVGQTKLTRYDADAAVLFTAGEIFDAHVAFYDASIQASIRFSYIPI